MKAKWDVRLGPAEWARHTHARDLDPSLQLLGSVQRGAQMGALAVDSQGEYFQVNGQHLAPLNKRLIAKAVAAAQKRAPGRGAPPPKPRPAPVVTVKRRRFPTSALQHTSGASGD